MCQRCLGFGGVSVGRGGKTVPDDLLGPQVAPTMSLQVIGPPSTGSKVVLWAESRLPRQTWSINESGHICSQMFEGQILDVKGKVGGTCGRRHLGELRTVDLESPDLSDHRPFSYPFHQVAGATTRTMQCCGS